ncbi:conserved protein of unknown function (plasmid) [Rhodovastum atsumiense]|uniref:Uncharacterized protein n=1 Tax=Rhodovastum atsumiense TaxID=504468 RepID=A0A5M6IVR7_9PROT|nr:hypothetical protein [Rhodovastum atsumiense]KAA5611598.1 hypothetical protein F1189_13625 [Rhodovastum atsumiense]CAH2606318.1 conserved protein of unknown function [Rhodovastum atsumiense]
MSKESDKLRAEWPGGEKQARQHLEGAGYKLNDDDYWEEPSPGYKPTDQDWSALEYLEAEFGYNGLIGEADPEED